MNHPSYPHLLFVHGGPGFDEYLQQTFEPATTALGFKSHFYQQLKRVPLNALVEQLANRVEETPSNKVVLVAHSWGVALALETIHQKLARNENIVGLVLIDGFISSEMDHEFAYKIEELGLTGKYSMEDIFLSKKDLTLPWTREYLSQILSTSDHESLEMIYKEYIESMDLSSFIQQLKLPTLVVFGSEDVRVPASYQRKYAALLPKGEILEIQDAGHFPFLHKSDLDLLMNQIKLFCELKIGNK